MKYVHTNLIAKDWRALSAFYQKVFGCKPVGSKRDLSGSWLDSLTGITDAHIEGEHLLLPGFEEGGPTLEIFSYTQMADTHPFINARGFSHIAFEVADVAAAASHVLSSGGSLLGEIVSKDYGKMGIGTFAYVKDPEGNLLELQSWHHQ